jgi:hypothetical protein
MDPPPADRQPCLGQRAWPGEDMRITVSISAFVEINDQRGTRARAHCLADQGHGNARLR